MFKRSILRQATSYKMLASTVSRSISTSNSVLGHTCTRNNSAYALFAMLVTACAGSSVYACMDGDNISSGDTTGGSHKDTRLYRRSEVAKHTSKSEGGIWVTYRDGVYDVTSFVANHPGGQDKLMMAAGKDLTELWKLAPFQQHFQSPLAFELLEEMRIGSLYSEDVVTLRKEDWEPRKAHFASDVLYDCIVVGSGLAGLQTVHSLINEHKIEPNKILILEAQDYVGGRVRQVSDFVKGIDIDVGAEFLHGTGTSLTKFAEDQDEKITKIFVWAHGDGGPMTETVNGGFGLYYFKERGLLRFDSKNPEFMRMNDVLWSIENLDENDFTDDVSLLDYLKGLNFSEEMLTMAAAGYSNTLCSNSRDVSLRQCIRWSKMWHEEEMQKEADGLHDGDYYFRDSYKVLIDYLKQDAQIEMGTPVSAIDYPLATTIRADRADGNDDFVEVTAKNGTLYQAKSVVVTSSPYVLKSGIMKFNPPLDTDITEALDTTHMHNIVKVIMKFKEPVWPRRLHGMICSDKSMLMPEIWFRVIDKEKVPKSEAAGAYAIGFCTADHADRIASMSKEEVMKGAVRQLDTIFGLLEPQHMIGDLHNIDDSDKMEKLSKPSESYIGGMFWDWNPLHHPYIGGGYCSPRVSTRTEKISILSEPVGTRLFFAGEGTMNPGATAHAAMDSGVRAAGYVAKLLLRVSNGCEVKDIQRSCHKNSNSDSNDNNAVIATSVKSWK